MKTNAIASILLLNLALLSIEGGIIGVNFYVVPSDFSTIQAAINAAQNQNGNEDRIIVTPGDYYEQLLISNKMNLTIIGEPGAVLHATSELRQTLRAWTPCSPIIAIIRSEVALQGLVMDGDHLGDLYRPLNGIFAAGSTVEISRCTIRGIRQAGAEMDIESRGLTFWNGADLGTGPVHLGLFDSTFEDNRISIIVAGDDEFSPSTLRTTFTIRNNRITAPFPTEGPTDGIDILPGAQGEVIGNQISGFLFAGGPSVFPSLAVGVYDGYAWVGPQRSPVRISNLVFEDNIFASNTVHLLLMLADRARVHNNTFQAGPVSTNYGAVAVSGLAVSIANNNFSEMSNAIVLLGGERFVNVSLGIASRPTLDGNWFCEVAEPVHIQPAAREVQQQNTQSCAAQPFFPSIGMGPAGATLKLRGWHGRPVVIESSTDLLRWLPVHTNVLVLPTLEHVESDVPATVSFFRAYHP